MYFHALGIGRSAWLKQANLDLGKLSERGFDQWPNFAPVESTVAATQRRDCDRADAKPLHLGHQIHKPIADEFHARFTAPVLVGGKIDDDVRLNQPAGIEDEHTPGLHFARLAGLFVCLSVLRPFIPELQRDAFTHHPDTIDCIDDRVDIVLLQEIAAHEPNSHGYCPRKYQAGLTSTGKFTPPRCKTLATSRCLATSTTPMRVNRASGTRSLTRNSA